MTKAELIAELSEFPDDMPVVISVFLGEDDGSIYDEINTVLKQEVTIAWKNETRDVILLLV